MKTVFIVDDHEMILPGIRMAIESLEGFQVIGQATDGLAAFNGIMEMRPDLAVIDLSIPVLSGFEIVRRLREKKNPVKVLLLTSFSEDTYIREALKLGVEGYVLKENSSAELLRALEAVCSGYRYLAPKIMTRVVEGLEEARRPDEYRTAVEMLSPRERDVLGLIAAGKKGKEICADLDISESTLKTHKAALMRKLNAGTTNELIIYAVKNDLFRE